MNNIFYKLDNDTMKTKELAERQKITDKVIIDLDKTLCHSINKNYSDEKKILLIEILWEIVLADGQVHDYESSIIRRLSGLLYTSDINSGNARKRALSKIS